MILKYIALNKTVSAQNPIQKITVDRSQSNPLITFESSNSLGENINGPSVIKVPTWIKNPLGKYYMYFAHHKGQYIRLAYANNIEGPWKIYESGTLQLKQASAFKGHIASPDVHIDKENKQIRMYFHAPIKNGSGQWTGVATSEDGIDFIASDEILGKFYFRVWRYKDYYYALAKNNNEGWGELYRSKDGLTKFESGGNFVERIRHSAVLVKENKLSIFYTRVGDMPERIVMTTVDMTSDWKNRETSLPLEILFPEKDYEGIQYPLKPSRYGAATHVQELRDPYIYVENDDIFLFYTIAGEMGIAVAKIIDYEE